MNWHAGGDEANETGKELRWVAQTVGICTYKIASNDPNPAMYLAEVRRAGLSRTN
jgi:hypothetical protein